MGCFESQAAVQGGDEVDIQAGFCNADPITAQGKRVQMAQLIVIPLIPILVLFGHTLAYLGDAVNAVHGQRDVTNNQLQSCLHLGAVSKSLINEMLVASSCADADGSTDCSTDHLHQVFSITDSDISLLDTSDATVAEEAGDGSTITPFSIGLLTDTRFALSQLLITSSYTAPATASTATATTSVYSTHNTADVSSNHNRDVAMTTTTKLRGQVTTTPSLGNQVKVPATPLAIHQSYEGLIQATLHRYLLIARSVRSGLLGRHALAYKYLQEALYSYVTVMRVARRYTAGLNVVKQDYLNVVIADFTADDFVNISISFQGDTSTAQNVVNFRSSKLFNEAAYTLVWNTTTQAVSLIDSSVTGRRAFQTSCDTYYGSLINDTLLAAASLSRDIDSYVSQGRQTVLVAALMVSLLIRNSCTDGSRLPGSDSFQANLVRCNTLM